MTDIINFKAFEALTISNSEVGFTTATVGVNDHAFCTLEGAAIRFRLDGTAASATVGHVLEPGDTLRLESGNELSNFRAFRRDGTDATLASSFGVKGA